MVQTHGEKKFTQKVRDVLQYASEESQRLGSAEIGIEHFGLGILRINGCIAVKFLQSLNINIIDLWRSIHKEILSASPLKDEPKKLNKAAEKLLKIVYLEAIIFKANDIGTHHLLLGILKDPDNIVTQILNQYGVNYDIMREEMELVSPEKLIEDAPPFVINLNSERRNAGMFNETHLHQPNPIKPEAKKADWRFEGKLKTEDFVLRYPLEGFPDYEKMYHELQGKFLEYVLKNEK